MAERRGAMLALLGLLAGPVLAHGGGPAGPGVTIPSLSHGQMAIIADHGGAIFALADGFAERDQDFRRILNYGRIQRSYCGWGLVPGSIGDEESPFNLCSHAWLAAAQELLIRMRAMPDHGAAVDALSRQVAVEMMEAGTGLSLCQFSADTFNTGAVITPDWAAVPTHPASAATALGLIGALGFGLWGLGRRR